MDKKKFVQILAYDAKLSLSKSSEVTDIFLENIIRFMEEGEDVRFKGFGTFTTRFQARSDFINPKSGKTVKSNPKTVPKMIFSGIVKDRIKGGEK